MSDIRRYYCHTCRVTFSTTPAALADALPALEAAGHRITAAPTVCDTCGDESNSDPGLPCGREHRDGACCTGRYQ